MFFSQFLTLLVLSFASPLLCKVQNVGISLKADKNREDCCIVCKIFAQHEKKYEKKHTKIKSSAHKTIITAKT